MERPIDFFVENKNKSIIVYLKDNSVIKGILVASDLNFNLYLKDVEYEKEGNKFKARELLLNGRAIKFVTI